MSLSVQNDFIVYGVFSRHFKVSEVKSDVQFSAGSCDQNAAFSLVHHFMLFTFKWYRPHAFVYSCSLFITNNCQLSITDCTDTFKRRFLWLWDLINNLFFINYFNHIQNLQSTMPPNLRSGRHHITVGGATIPPKYTRWHHNISQSAKVFFLKAGC